MLIYQGEQVTFNGYLKDDAGSRITNLSGYTISATLCKNDVVAVKWSTASVSDALSITVGSGGLVSFVLPSAKTCTLIGKYTFEAKVTSPGGDVAIAVSEDTLSVALSNIGQDSNL